MELKQISKASSKEFYQILIEKKQEMPTSEETWISEFPFMESAEWKNIYKQPFKITSEPCLQSFQYKILNRILNCNDNLYKWKIKPDNICLYCDKIDTIEHHLYECNESKYFWNRLENWTRNNLEVSFPFTICEIIFGIHISKDCDIDIMNYLILIGKWYINSMRNNETELFFITFLNEVRKKLELLLLNNSIHNRQNLDWQEKLSSML